MRLGDERFEAGKVFLAERGVNLCAVLDLQALPGDVIGLLLEAGINVTDYLRLVLLGNGGKRFWSGLQEFGFHTDDPVDHYALYLTRQFLHDFLGDPHRVILYPGRPIAVPLTRLGELAGWGAPSPVFVGINPEFGPWFAYRSAFLVDLALPLSQASPPPYPCDACAAKPCLQACPASAVHWPGPSDIDVCARSRMADGSLCANRCLARMACPVGAEHRYTLEQIQYHYAHSLGPIRRYYEHLLG